MELEKGGRRAGQKRRRWLGEGHRMVLEIESRLVVCNWKVRKEGDICRAGSGNWGHINSSSYLGLSRLARGRAVP
jgi:hypothetical protein